ncbi:MAG: peroxiredoxin family protein [Candidatus Eiseniibacteriota bacterium]
MTIGSPLKVAGLLLGVFAVGIAGVLVGSALRGTVGRGDAYVAADPAATSLLKPGMTFPDAATAGGPDARTAAMTGTGGTAFLFLDLECPPCVDMAAKWQTVLDQGALPELRVVGITNHPPEHIGSFREEHGITFPIVEDTDHLFLRDWRVQRFPLEVVVGPDGRILSVSYDSVNPVDLPSLAGRLQS